MAADLLQLNSRIKPEIDTIEAQKLVERLYPYRVHTIRELDSYDDRNFRIRVINEHEENINEFVLKVTNSLDSAVPGLIEAINAISMFVKDSTGIKVPIPVPTVKGDLVARETLSRSKTNSEYAIRLVTYVEGAILNTIEYTPDILNQVGTAVGRLTQGLKDFDNPVLASRRTIWSLLNVVKLDEFMSAINDQRQLALIKKIIEKYEADVSPFIEKLPTSIIHGDINEQNIVVDLSTEDEPSYKFTGLIDFGDSHKAPTVFDLAILCAYAMLDCPARMHPLDSPKYIIAGYESVRTLTDLEYQILPACILARFAQSVTLGMHTHKNDPANEYLLSSARKMWRIMDMMIIIEDQVLLKRWKEAI